MPRAHPRAGKSPARLLSLLPLLLATAVAAAAEVEPPPAADDPAELALDAIETHVRASMERHRTPGLAVALTRRDALAAVRTWGHADLKLGRPVTPDTLFQIGSISKSFTALALLGLAEEGRLDLGAPVRRYLPWFEVGTELEPIRVEHLLTHTAGIPANRDDIVSSPYMARALREQAAAWRPGDRFHYSNVGYQVLHALLEAVSGESYREVVEQRILAPLGMASSRAEIALDSRREQAIGYVPAYDDRPSHRSRALVEAPFHEYRIGDGAIQATAADLAAYLRMWLHRGAGPDGRIVSAASFERFATPHPGTLSEDGAVGYGLGVGVSRRNGRPVLRHSGGMIGFLAQARASLDEGLAVAVLMNGPGEPGELARLALAAWRAALAGAPFPEPPADDGEEWPGDLSQYAGRFASAGGEAVEFRQVEGRLALVRGDAEIALDRTGADQFYSPAPGLDRYRFAFGRDPGGAVVEVSHGAAWYVNDRYTGPREFEAPAAWSAYAGRYRSFSPWFPYFEVMVRKGRLLAVTGEGGETASGETVLLPAGEGVFRVGREITPEWLRFDEPVDGRALRAVWSGHPFFRQ